MLSGFSVGVTTEAGDVREDTIGIYSGDGNLEELDSQSVTNNVQLLCCYYRVAWFHARNRVLLCSPNLDQCSVRFTTYFQIMYLYNKI